ncbi:MAG: hypothetical protein Hals2KO_16760 [Halioglobus sp.]
METLIVQTGMRHGRVAELARSSRGVLSIGRGYDNDLVLTDAHIAPRQILFFRDGDIWRMEVLDNTNPVFLNDTVVDTTSPQVNPGDAITIGRTRLTLHSPDQPVEKTRKLVLANWLSGGSVGFLLPLAVLLFAAAVDLVVVYLLQSTDLKWGGLLSAAMLGIAIALGWAGLWALGGRIVRHQHHFGLQLIATASVLLLATFIELAATFLAWPFHNAQASELLEWLAYFAWVAILLHLNLLIATNLMRSGIAAALLSAIISGGLYAYYWFAESDVEYNNSVPSYSSTLLPPLLIRSAGASAEEYFARLQQEAEKLGKDD